MVLQQRRWKLRSCCQHFELLVSAAFMSIRGKFFSWLHSESTLRVNYATFTNAFTGEGGRKLYLALVCRVRRGSRNMQHFLSLPPPLDLPLKLFHFAFAEADFSPFESIINKFMVLFHRIRAWGETEEARRKQRKEKH